MTTTPDMRPGSSSVSTAYARSGLALVIAVAGFLATAALLFSYPHVRIGWVAILPAWALSLIDVVVLSVPLVAAVVVAVVWFASRPAREALGLGSWRWTDIAMGVAIALVVRAAVELIAPTTGSLGGAGFGAVPSPAVQLVSATVLVLGAVVISPVVEELFFRGLVVRAMIDALQSLGRWVGAAMAVIVSTGGFVALHLAGTGAGIPLSLLAGTVGVGLGTGILVAVSGRLDGALALHMTFNALGVGILLI